MNSSAPLHNMSTAESPQPPSNSLTPSPASETNLQAAVRWLDSDTETGLDRVVTVAMAADVLVSITARDGASGVEEGERAARMLMGFYPAREVNDAVIFVRGMTAMMAAYPVDFVRRVIDPVNGLPSRLKWLPTLADVKAALEAEKARRNRIAANARYVLDLDRQRQAKAADDARWEAERARLTPEQRKQLAEGLVAQIKAVPVVDPEAPQQAPWKPSPEVAAELARRRAERESTDDLTISEFLKRRGKAA